MIFSGTLTIFFRKIISSGTLTILLRKMISSGTQTILFRKMINKSRMLSLIIVSKVLIMTFGIREWAIVGKKIPFSDLQSENTQYTAFYSTTTFFVISNHNMKNRNVYCEGALPSSNVQQYIFVLLNASMGVYILMYSVVANRQVFIHKSSK